MSQDKQEKNKKKVKHTQMRFQPDKLKRIEIRIHASIKANDINIIPIGPNFMCFFFFTFTNCKYAHHKVLFVG